MRATRTFRPAARNVARAEVEELVAIAKRFEVEQFSRKLLDGCDPDGIVQCAVFDPVDRHFGFRYRQNSTSLGWIWCLASEAGFIGAANFFVRNEEF